MCRNIKVLYNFEPPATKDEIREASLQFVRKVSGFREPSEANEHVYLMAVDEIERVVKEMLDGLVTNAEPKNREEEARRAHERAVKRFGKG